MARHKEQIPEITKQVRQANILTMATIMTAESRCFGPHNLKEYMKN